MQGYSGRNQPPKLNHSWDPNVEYSMNYIRYRSPVTQGSAVFYRYSLALTVSWYEPNPNGKNQRTSSLKVVHPEKSGIY